LRWLGLWTFLGLVSSAQFYLAHQRPGADPYSWPQAFEAGLPGWYLWGLLSLVVAWLARHFRLGRATFERHFVIHLGASLDLALLHLMAAVGVQNVLHALRGEPYPFARHLIDDFVLFYHWNVLFYWAIVAAVHALDYHRELETRPAAPPGASPEPAFRPAERLLVGDNGRSFFVRTADVEWIEADKNYVRLHAGEQTHVVRTTLTALEARLDRERFRRTGRSVLVNVDRVREVQPWFHGDAIVILQSGARVTLSRRYRSNLLGTPAL
jgi:LytTr DNA-binding domain-containing protein